MRFDDTRIGEVTRKIFGSICLFPVTLPPIRSSTRFVQLSRFTLGSLFLYVMNCVSANAQTWEPVTGDDELRMVFADTIFETTLSEGTVVTARYNADGTGEVTMVGQTFPREWRIDGDDLVCIKISGRFDCFRLEKNTSKDNEYRGTNLSTGEVVVFEVSSQGVARTGPVPASGVGGAAALSDEELAAKLANPTVPVMTIGNNFDYVAFKGDLSEANDQDAFRYTFQTVFPFKLRQGGSVFFRPAIPVLFNDPVPGAGGFDSVGVDLGDTGFDFSYGTTTDSGLIWGGGLVGTLPTATDDALGKDQWALGPELLLGQIGDWGVLTAILSHQWDISGGDPGVETNLTSLNYIYAFPMGNGWQFSAAPAITYDHTRPTDKLTLPLGIGVAKTTTLGGRIWKFQIQYWNYVKGSAAFSPEHQIRISINPVIEAPWNRRK